MKTVKFNLKNLVLPVFFFSTFILLTGCPMEDEEELLSLSSSKQITAFSIATPASTGVINESAKTVVVDVPAGTNVTALKPSITVSDKANVNPGLGVATNFTNPVQYTVIAEDGSTATYTVTVNKAGGGSTNEAQELKSPISENLTIKDLGLPIDYIVKSNVTINNNAIVTIEPGVCIAFERTNGYIEVRAGATVKMNGTAAKPIQFRGSGATSGTEKGSWGYIDIGTNSDNILEYVEFINGGSSSNNGALRITGSGTASISNCKITGSLGQGINTSSSATIKKFRNNTVTGCAKEPVYLGHVSQAADFDISSDLKGNTNDYVSLNNGFIEDDDLTLNPSTVPYSLSTYIIVRRILTIKEGVVFYMNPDTYIDVDEIGCVKMLGTAAKPIKFMPPANNTEPGSWHYIRISTNNDNILENVEIYYGGKNTSWGSLIINSGTASIKNCSIIGSKNNGLYVLHNSNIKSFTGNKITKCGNSPVYLTTVENACGFDKTSDLTGNNDDYITIHGGTVKNADVTTNETTVPYYLDVDIDVQKTWTINDAVVYMGGSTDLSTLYSGRIIAKNVNFTRLPNQGYYWSSIVLSGDNSSSFTGCTFEYGGSYNNYGIINIDYTAEHVFNNCTIRNTNQYGVRIGYAGSTNKVKVTNVKFSNCVKGNVYDASSGLVFTSF